MKGRAGNLRTKESPREGAQIDPAHDSKVRSKIRGPGLGPARHVTNGLRSDAMRIAQKREQTIFHE
jgi:hypothetical protein